MTGSVQGGAVCDWQCAEGKECGGPSVEGSEWGQSAWGRVLGER